MNSVGTQFKPLYTIWEQTHCGYRPIVGILYVDETIVSSPSAFRQSTLSTRICAMLNYIIHSLLKYCVQKFVIYTSVSIYIITIYSQIMQLSFLSQCYMAIISSPSSRALLTGNPANFLYCGYILKINFIFYISFKDFIFK